MGSETSGLSSTIARYAMWLSSHEGLGTALCWTVARSVADAVSVMDVVSSDWQQEAVVDLAGLVELSSEDEDSDREHAAWLIDTGQHVALLELNGFGGSHRPLLNAWMASAGSVAGMYWDVNMVNQLSIARDGQLAVAELWAEADIGDEAPLIAGYQASLSEGTDLRAFGLAVVEAETGLRLDDDLLAKQWPLVRFAVVDVDERLADEDGDADGRLFAALAAVSDERFREAKALTSEYVSRVNGLEHEPAVRQAIAATRTGLEVRHDSQLARDLGGLGARLYEEVRASPFKPGDLKDPALRRKQASTVVEWLTRVHRSYSDNDPGFDIAQHFREVWSHAGYALGNEWAALRQQLLDQLN